MVHPLENISNIFNLQAKPIQVFKSKSRHGVAVHEIWKIQGRPNNFFFFFEKCFKKNYRIFSQISCFIWKHNPSGS